MDGARVELAQLKTGELQSLGLATCPPAHPKTLSDSEPNAERPAERVLGGPSGMVVGVSET